MMNKAIIAVVAASMTCAGGAAFARGGGGTGGGMGGNSGSHMSPSGIKNTNGPNSPDRDKGLDRAEDRMSKQGAAHEKADRPKKRAKATFKSGVK